MNKRQHEDRQDEPVRPPKVGEDIDAATSVLNRMREAALARGERRTAAGRTNNQRGGERRRSGHSRQDVGRDPQGLSNVVERLVKERGWTAPVAVGSVMAQWNQLVGPEISAHCQPDSFADTTVAVRCDSTAWATQLRLLSPNLLAKFDAELGQGVVTKIHVMGPAAPSWRKGNRAVSGRGPRDTYG
ncbi:MAG TPA: DciA family protein [Arthrobacter sp.]|nr:DciA family protein [Arthrobacter sp.]